MWKLVYATIGGEENSMKFIITMTLPESWFERRAIVAELALSQLRMRVPVRLIDEDAVLRRVNKTSVQTLVSFVYEAAENCTVEDALTWAESAEAAALRALAETRLSRGFRLYVQPPVDEARVASLA